MRYQSLNGKTGRVVDKVPGNPGWWVTLDGTEERKRCFQERNLIVLVDNPDGTPQGPNSIGQILVSVFA